MEHKKHQEANDWITCKCGKLFSDERDGLTSKYEKLEDHINSQNKAKSSLKNNDNKNETFK